MQPHTVRVIGSFRYLDPAGEKRPVSGLIRFTPERLWVIKDGITWATLSARARLDEDGAFCVELTPTDTDALWWHYLVETPAGGYRVRAPWSVDGHLLTDLIKSARGGRPVSG